MSDRLDMTVDSRDIRSRARTLVACVNGVARLRKSNSLPIIVGTIQCVRADGSRRTVMMMDPIVARFKATATFGVMRGDSRKLDIPATTAFDLTIDRALSSPRLATVLEIMGQAQPSWQNLWVAYELIQGHGSEGAAIIKRLDPGDRFSHTCNCFDVLGIEARHAKKKMKAPENPMTLDDARLFLRQCVLEWWHTVKP
jgi:hypothetical protein